MVTCPFINPNAGVEQDWGLQADKNWSKRDGWSLQEALYGKESKPSWYAYIPSWYDYNSWKLWWSNWSPLYVCFAGLEWKCHYTE